MTHPRSRALLLGVGAALLGTLGVLACSSDGEDEAAPGTNGPEPEPLFRALQGDLVSTCGGANGSCHVRGTEAPRWLADPDPYASAKRYRGIVPITREVGDSILLTQVDHVGPSLKRFPALYERVAAWLQAEVPPPPLPSSGAFSVRDGFNVVNLDTMGEGFAGARLTFLATQANNVLTLDALRVQAPSNANMTLASPFFVILPRSGKVNADKKANGFVGELTVDAGTTVDLFTGRMILLRWDQAGQLKIVFDRASSTPGRGAAEGCTALDVFTSKAIPAMQAQVDVLADDTDGGAGSAVIGKGSCLGCHAKQPDPGEAPGAPVQAMDLRGYDTDPAKACAQARLWINFEDKAKSTLLLNPTGQANPNHPMRSLDAKDPIVQGLDAWVQAEQR